MPAPADDYLALLDDLLDVRVLIANLRHQKKPDDGPKPPANEVNRIDAHIRVLEAMEKHLSGRKTYFVAQLMLLAADVPMPAFDAAATHHIGERVREIATELNVDLREEIAPWIAEAA